MISVRVTSSVQGEDLLGVGGKHLLGVEEKAPTGCVCGRGG